MGKHLLVRAFILCLVLASGVVLMPATPAGAVGTWTQTGPVPGEIGASHTATRLADGRVLIAGGWGGGAGGALVAIDTVQIYDPISNQWRLAAPMAHPRMEHSAVLLPDGKVLVIGGRARSSSSGSEMNDTVERYDPATDRWLPATSGGFNWDPDVALLPNGQVLVVGARYTDGRGTSMVKRYDPATDRWLPVADPPSPGWFSPTVLLPDGRVLVAGGNMHPSESFLYDPIADRWTTTGPMTNRRSQSIAQRLADGRVLVIGGDGAALGPPGAAATAEIYDPQTDRWIATGNMTNRYLFPVAALLPNGKVLVAGDRVKETETYDPLSNQWSPSGQFLGSGRISSATTLPDGSVLVVSGAPSAAARYLEGTPFACFTETARCTNGTFFAYWQAHGGLAINGFPITNERQEQLEDGRVYAVQYFERVRMEYHPEYAGTPNAVLLGQFGRKIHPADPPVLAKSGYTFFEQTGHNVSPRFLSYREANGGLTQFGLPLSEELTEILEDGKPYLVQYFERARFEYHPEIADPRYQVLLGQFGRRILGER